MIQKLIQEDKIEIFLQPIISAKDKKIFAFEALTRAYDENNDLISPLFLFEEARKENMSNILDCYVRQKAITKFKNYYNEDKDLRIFLNFESSMINNSIEDNFLNVVIESEINPANIVIEIKEDSVDDNTLLANFVKKYREFGFIIAIDDFGTGYSSYDRLALIHPDIVKIDRSLIFDVDDNFINSEILSSISNMCHKIGALVLAEGVESKNEILACMKKDIDIFQGFYFSKPKKDITISDKKIIHENIDNIGKQYKDIINKHIEKKQKLLKNSKELVNEIIGHINLEVNSSLSKIEKIVSKNKHLEAIYLLDFNTAIQIHNTIIDSEQRNLFVPTKHGHDHSLKEYYFIAKESLRGDYLSTKYISKASGNMCRTYSIKLSLENKDIILCLDIKV